MNTALRASCLAILALSLVIPIFAAAQQEDTSRQAVHISINNDATANGTWLIPFIPDYADQYLYIPEFKSYGAFASTHYKLLSVQDLLKRPVSTQQVQDDIMEFRHATSSRGIEPYYVNYLLTPYFTKPVAVYEFWIADGVQRLNTTMDIVFPSSWKVLDMWPPEAVVTGNTVHIPYDPSRQTVRPVIMLFDIGGGGVIQKTGKYTVSGSPEEVKKIISALPKLASVDDLMQKTIGLKIPDSVFIVADNVSQVGQIGYEAQALAGSPNIIVFNDALTRSKTTDEISEVLAHELTHLAVASKPIFKGYDYNIPFFSEGIAVYFQGVAHRAIFTNSDERILTEDLLRTHVIGPSEAKVLYESEFDEKFDGTRPLGVGASYMQAGLLFSRFADKVGEKGFEKLFENLAQANHTLYSDVDSDTTLNALRGVSGLSVDQLEYPGKLENDIDATVARISRPDNDETRSTDLIVHHIQQDIHRYFSASPTALIATTSSSSTNGTAVKTNGNMQVLKRNLSLGSKGSDVSLLQQFLIKAGFLDATVVGSGGYYGRATRAAVIAFQKSQNIDSVGSIGLKTRTKINETLSNQ